MGRASNKFWELESKLPSGVKKYTDRAIRHGYRAMRPLRADSKRRGEEWWRGVRKKYRV